MCETMGGSDCCLFAIAFAASLCMRKDPHTERYAQTEMRQHLARCFEEKKITSFPKSDARRRLRRHRIINRKKVDVFCIYAVSPGTNMMENVGPLVQCVLCKK